MACTHVVKGGVLTLFAVPADSENDTLAWCAECEAARIADKGWYDAADAVANWGFICGECYGRVLDKSLGITYFEGDVTPSERPDA
jgi:hypothetical protein